MGDDQVRTQPKGGSSPPSRSSQTLAMSPRGTNGGLGTGRGSKGWSPVVSRKVLGGAPTSLRHRVSTTVWSTTGVWRQRHPTRTLNLSSGVLTFVLLPCRTDLVALRSSASDSCVWRTDGPARTSVRRAPPQTSRPNESRGLDGVSGPPKP